MLKSNYEFHELDFTRNRFHLRIQKSKHEFIYNTFSHQSIYIWNMILNNLNMFVSFAKFKFFIFVQ